MPLILLLMLRAIKQSIYFDVYGFVSGCRKKNFEKQAQNK
jgi:hypothetical protein